MTERFFACLPCLLDGRVGVPADDMDGLATVCPDHKAAAMRLCVRCNYWVAVSGGLCTGCAEETAA